MLKRVLLAGAIALVVPQTGFAPQQAEASPEIFGKMEGRWRGKGLVRSNAKGKKESIRCRMSNKMIDDGKKLDIGGSCAVSGFVFSLNGYIEQTGGNRYRASMFRSLASIKQESFGGKRSGSRINFSFNATDRTSKKPIRALIRMNVNSASAYEIQISRTDTESGKIFDVGTLKFAKR